MTAEQILTDVLVKNAQNFTYYGVFFDGKLVCMTKARVYLQPGRAKAEFLSQNKYSLTKGLIYDPSLNFTETRKSEKKQIYEAFDALVKQGRLEIKKV